MYNKFDIMMTTVFVYLCSLFIYSPSLPSYYLYSLSAAYALRIILSTYDVVLPMYHLVDCLFTTHAPSPPKSIVLPHVQSLSIPRCFNYTHTYSTVNQTLFQVICLLPPSISICMLQLSDSNSLK